MDKTVIGKLIKEARTRQGLTQEKLADLVSMHEKHISRIELGKFLPNLENLLKIFEVLGIELPKQGFKVELPTEKDLTRTEILKLINNSTTNELEFYLPLLKQARKGLAKYFSAMYQN